jgi:peptidoglycan/LPS O-acetylase OafA/YrhL
LEASVPLQQTRLDAVGGGKVLAYWPALDGIRALAILIVIGKHAFNYPQQGGLGVDLFFVLSGFLISIILLEEHERTGRISLRDFYRRRALRLLPALGALLAVAVPVLLLTASSRGTLIGLAGAFTYTSNFLLVLVPDQLPEALRHLWSLAQEEQFYAIWPVALVVLLRRRPALISYVLVTALMATMLASLVLAARGATLERLYYSPDTHSGSILVGCLVALAYYQGVLPRVVATVRARRITSIVSALLVLGFPFVVGHRWQLLYAAPGYVLFSAAAGLLILCAVFDDTPIVRLLGAAPMRFVGITSYALYLWHVPILVALGVHSHFEGWRSFAGVGLSLTAATISYFVIERPFLRMKTRRGSPSISAAAPAPATG